MCIHFFFQAEDGIRDRNVTGVQTCALPILLKYIIVVIELLFCHKFFHFYLSPYIIISALSTIVLSTDTSKYSSSNHSLINLYSFIVISTTSQSSSTMLLSFNYLSNLLLKIGS